MDDGDAPPPPPSAAPPPRRANPNLKNSVKVPVPGGNTQAARRRLPAMLRKMNEICVEENAYCFFLFDSAMATDGDGGGAAASDSAAATITSPKRYVYVSPQVRNSMINDRELWERIDTHMFLEPTALPPVLDQTQRYNALPYPDVTERDIRGRTAQNMNVRDELVTVDHFARMKKQRLAGSAGVLAPLPPPPLPQSHMPLLSSPPSSPLPTPPPQSQKKTNKPRRKKSADASAATAAAATVVAPAGRGRGGRRRGGGGGGGGRGRRRARSDADTYVSGTHGSDNNSGVATAAVDAAAVVGNDKDALAKINQHEQVCEQQRLATVQRLAKQYCDRADALYSTTHATDTTDIHSASANWTRLFQHLLMPSVISA